MAGHRPFELLYRDLELVLSRAEEVGAQVALVTYPNPSEDHTALREVLASFAKGRRLTFVDSYGVFEERFSDDPEGWAAHLGPNGHANAAGYRFMADDVLTALRESRVLDEAAEQLFAPAITNPLLVLTHPLNRTTNNPDPQLTAYARLTCTLWSLVAPAPVERGALINGARRADRCELLPDGHRL